MLRKRFSNKPHFFYFLLLGIAFSVLLTAAPLLGQSGRRTQTKPLPTPIPETAPEKKTPEPKPALKPEISLKIVSNIPTPVYNRIPFPEKMLQWLNERLESSKLLKVKSQHTGSIKDAKRMAEQATDEYIVFVDLDENIYAAGTPPQLSREWEGEMWISFSVFAPQNAKAKQSGRAYLKPELLRGRGILSSRTASCYPTLTDSDYLLWQASFEAGEKIIAGFGFPVPTAKCGGQGF